MFRRKTVGLLIACTLVAARGIPSSGQEVRPLQTVRQLTAHDKLAQFKQKLDRAVQRLQAESRFPGCSVSLVFPYGDTITATAGFADQEQQLPMKPADRMMSASIGKTYFAAIATELLLERKLSLEHPVSRYLGEREGFADIPNANEITIAHLMRHQSGIPRYLGNRKVWEDMLRSPDLVWNPGDQLQYVYGSKPLHQVGQGWAYSDTNYILLGLVLEKITGKSAYRLVQEKLLRPNRLEDTIPNDRRKLPGLVQGYSTRFRALQIPPRMIRDGELEFNPQMEWCGGGFVSTSSDLARWIHLYFSGSLFDAAYVDRLTDDAADCQGRLGPSARYGLGVILRDGRLGRSLGHDGVFPGYSSTAAYFPDRGVAAALMFNTDDPRAISKAPHEVLVDLVDSVLAK